jgi:hypothetical protein
LPVVGTRATSSLTIGVIALVAVVFVVVRRMRPQAVNPTRVILLGAVFVVLLLLALGSDVNTLLRDFPAIIAAPFAIVLGGVLGYVIVRSMTFWVDQQSGLLWMRGGVLFAVIYVVALLLRVGTSYLSSAGTNSTLLEQAPWLRGLSADLIFLSIGMWVVRAAMIYNRYRQHVAQGGVPIAGSAR